MWDSGKLSSFSSLHLVELSSSSRLLSLLTGGWPQGNLAAGCSLIILGWGLRGHEVVNCIDGAGGRGSGAAEIVTGGREGSVKVWDVRVSNRETVTLLVLYLDQIRFDMDI